MFSLVRRTEPRIALRYDCLHHCLNVAFFRAKINAHFIFSPQHKNVVIPGTPLPFEGELLSCRFALAWSEEPAGFFCCWFVSLGAVTPGMTGRLTGGVRDRGDWRICIRKLRSYTILVPVTGTVKEVERVRMRCCFSSLVYTSRRCSKHGSPWRRPVLEGHLALIVDDDTSEMIAFIRIKLFVSRRTLH